MIADLKKSAEQKMQKTVDALKHDYQKVRTGRAHTGLLDHIQVDYYGSMMPINVFSIFKKDALQRVVVGEYEGTLVHV